MTKTGRMLELEKRVGRPLEDAFKEAYARHGSIKGMAGEFGIPEDTAYNWMLRLGLSPVKMLQ